MDYDANKDFTTLVAWTKARSVRQFFYRDVIPRLPKDEKFNLDHQIRRACVSSTANIAEGYGRHSFREGVRFCLISRGSLFELKDHLITSFEQGYLTDELFAVGTQTIEAAKIALSGYIKYMESNLKTQRRE